MEGGDMKYCVYDIETLKNCITLCFREYEKKIKKSFVLFDDYEELVKLVKFLKSLKREGYYLVGMNNVHFDGQILEFILGSYEHWLTYNQDISEIITEIYEEAQRIINLSDEDKYKQTIHESKFSIKPIDLFKQNHYDGKAKRGTSLKWLQFTMNYWNIEDMPIQHDTWIDKNDIETILSYNWNDVESTEEFFTKTMFNTELRAKLSERYKIDLMNASEPKIARDVFAKFLCDAMDISYRELKTMQTHRQFIKVKDIIFPYHRFEDKNLQNLLATLNKTVLTPDEGFEKVFKVGNLEVTFGLGGLHSNNKPGIFESKNGKIIRSCDVKSMYPNLAIRNKLKPEHLGDIFLEVYENIYNERIAIPKSDPINYVLKIILNSTYGLSGEPNSYLYDVQFTRAICINGQLSLLMLADMIKSKIPNVQFIMMNTDGIEVMIDEKDNALYEEICKEWEKLTNLELEFEDYKKMVIRDVNNYLAVNMKNYVKRKGAFEYKMDWHKNPSFIIIPKAIEEYFVKGTPYKKFILNHKNLYDFCGGVKKKSDFNLAIYKLVKGKVERTEQQKVCRFFPSKAGGRMFKEYKSAKKKASPNKGRIGVLVDYKVDSINKVTEKTEEQFWKNLDYTYFLLQARERIHEIEGDSKELKMEF